MKRLIAGVMGLICAFSIGGCNSPEVGPGRPVSAYIGDYVTQINITHYISGKSIQWIAENDEVDRIREWASKLKYEIFEYEKGQSPGDGDGGEVYAFVLTEGDYPGFSYVINGPDDCYLLIEGYWYSVSNPSTPPVTVPEQ